MPRMSRTSRAALRDRPGRIKLLLRRQRWLLRPTVWVAAALAGVAILASINHAFGPGGALAGWRDSLARMTVGTGLSVRNVLIEGRANTPEPLLRAAIGVVPGSSILGFSVAAARTRIESLAWVERASVERQLPGTIVVRLVERRPFAVWQNQGKFVLIDRDGQVVGEHDVAEFKQLPLVVGAGAPAVAAALFDLLEAHPAIGGRVVAAVRVGERRWNLRLNSGADVLLPEGQEAAALDRLNELQESQGLLDRPLKVVDLRLPDRLVVRPQIEPQPPVARRPT
jgi:cell division protein FtsQ